jgi:formate hydrogenlyase subunit 3/multisubunit Na+/H+ antiporter MnhD subunit
MLFMCFFTGFAIKAGFVPFHTWLPYAHPVAPAHVSGMMSGVMIKLGIFGILRMLLLMNQNYLIIGYFILIISIISGIYGVILAIVQHNLKKLLAYHSIENIGIIGIGIGIGAIGVGEKNAYLAFAGFAGALLHTLNHSLFKSLLFYGSGTIYQAIHTLNIDSMGGLIKKMPKTAITFLIGALAICGLPPFKNR